MGHHRERQRRGQRESGKGEREGDEGGSETGLNYFGGCRAPRSPLSRKRGGGHTELVTCGLWGPSTHSLMGHHRERQRRGKRETAKCDREAIDGVRKGTGLITFGVAAPNDPLSHDDKVARVADHSRVNSRLHPGPRSVPLVNVDPKTHFIPPFLTNPLALSLSERNHQSQICRQQGCLAPRVSGTPEPTSVKLRWGVCGTMPPHLHPKARCSCMIYLRHPV